MKLPNGYGAIIKLKGARRNPYGVRITLGYNDKGVQTRKFLCYCPTYKEALQELALYNENPYDIETRKITLEKLHKKWKTEKYPKIAPKTQQVYNMCWNYCQDIKENPFIEIKTLQLQAMVDSMDDKWSAKKAFRIFFHQLYEFANKNELNIKDISEYIDIGKKTTKLERVPFEQWEIDKLWEYIDRMDYIDTVLILIYTGMRVGELMEIEIENVFLDEDYMRGGLKTEAGINRVIPIHPKIKPLIKKYYDLAVSLGCKYLITNSQGEQMKYSNYRREKWDKMMEQLELQDGHKPHDTRHTFATRMDRTPANKLCIKRIMGHASQDVTSKVYTHKDIQDLIQAINYLE